MKAFRELDRVLRGEASQSGVVVSLGPLMLANVLLAAFYGVCMGVYSIANREQPEFRFMFADMAKVPLLFVLTLLVTFPSLYVFNALVRSPLRMVALTRLLMQCMGVVVALLAAFGPIVGFFSVTTQSYPFIVLLNVVVLGFSAAFGLITFLKMLEQLLPTKPEIVKTTRYSAMLPPPTSSEDMAKVDEPPSSPVAASSLPSPSPMAARRVIQVWMVVFGVVGLQMSWILRPFIGSPTAEFAWFKPRESSFFEAVLNTIRSLFS